MFGSGFASSSDGQFFRAGGFGRNASTINAHYGDEPGVKSRAQGRKGARAQRRKGARAQRRKGALMICKPALLRNARAINDKVRLLAKLGAALAPGAQ